MRASLYASLTLRTRATAPRLVAILVLGAACAGYPNAASTPNTPTPAAAPRPAMPRNQTSTDQPAKQGPPPPPTRVEEVVDVVHGTKVVDPYRWLEDGEAAPVKRWTDAQNAHTRAHLEDFAGRAAIERRLWELFQIGSLGVPVPKGKAGERRFFYTRRDGKQNQAILYVRQGEDPASDRALVDVNALSAGGTVALDWWFPSEDGRRVAYGISRDGSEESELRVRDVATGADLPDVIPRTRHAALAWLPDGSGFYYTKYPEKGTVPAGDENYHRRVYFHALGGDPARDPEIFGAGRDKTDWPGVTLSPDGRWLVIEVGQGWSKSEVFLIDRKAGAQRKGHTSPPAAKTVIAGQAALYNVAEVTNDAIWIQTNEGAPRYRVFKVDPKKPARAAWREILPEAEDTLEAVGIVGGHLVTRSLRDASSVVRLRRLDGALVREVPLPGLGTVSGSSGQLEGGELFYDFTSYLQPTIIFRHDLATGTGRIWKQIEAPLDPSAFVVRQVRYPSKDGTSIPMFLVHKKGLTYDGKNPTLLYGYGGFNISLTPALATRVVPLLEAGGIFAEANLRGGAEYGESWHQAGMLGRKQNVFDDFIAAAEYLIREKLTAPERLAVSGRSNGGLLAGAALTQRPELFRAVISGVPLLDMIRYPKFRIAKLWIPEYGDPDKPDEFAWLHAYSPYHRVVDGTRYPAVFIFTAESDTRVDPMHARKMTARLQAASTSGRPVLLRLESQAGHGMGKPLAKVIDQYTDELVFLFRELGVAPPYAP